MKLSIIVPVYNMASDGKLNYCLDSLAAQTISDYEVITVDDASTDESFSILLEYEKKYPGKFKAVHSEVNKRQGGAKNIGLSLAKGEWIGFIDSDDWILPTMYEKLIGRAEETGADMVGCDYCLTDEHSMKIGKRVENGKAEQSGVLGNKQCRSLILDSGSLVVKVYSREIIMDSGIQYPEHNFNLYQLFFKPLGVYPHFPIYAHVDKVDNLWTNSTFTSVAKDNFPQIMID